MLGVATHGDALVAISASPTEVWLSEPSGQWTETGGVNLLRDQVISSIASAARGRSSWDPGHIWTSTDGRSWENADAPLEDGNVYDVVAGGPGFVAGSTYVGSMEAVGRVWTSPDGREWGR